MVNHKHNIAIVEPSPIIQHGLLSLINQHSTIYQISSFSDLLTLNNFIRLHKISVIIINSGIIAANQKLINSLKKENSNIAWIALLYQYVNPNVISQFTEVITIDQDSHDIIALIDRSIQTNKEHTEDLKTENLSDREIDVLKLLVTGYSGKEIADKLSISVNTVISHRKNISQKTGIKSLAGLTIYAVANHVITMSSLQK